MPKMHILSGIPGSGKSYQAKKLVSDVGVILSTDDYFVGPDGVYRFDRSKLSEAHAWNFRNAVDCVKEGYQRIVIDNTNLTAAEISPYYMLGCAFGYDVEILRISCPENIAYCRQRHGVPSETHARMADAFRRRDLLPWWPTREIRV